VIPPVGIAIAAMTVMLWILWRDTVRPRRPSPILYTMRVALYLIVSGLLTLNMVRYPAHFSGSARVVAIMAVIVGVIGAGYFARRLVRRA
jgi:hypothetical protein